MLLPRLLDLILIIRVFSGFLEVEKTIVRTTYQKEYLRNHNIKNIDVIYKIPPTINNKNNVLGVYTSGFWARKKTRSNIDYIKKAELAEKKLIHSIELLAKNNPNMLIRLYIHQNNDIEY